MTLKTCIPVKVPTSISFYDHNPFSYYVYVKAIRLSHIFLSEMFQVEEGTYLSCFLTKLEVLSDTNNASSAYRRT
jgi:hypothetical protein